jgi:hypothetical protein
MPRGRTSSKLRYWLEPAPCFTNRASSDDGPDPAAAFQAQYAVAAPAGFSFNRWHRRRRQGEQLQQAQAKVLQEVALHKHNPTYAIATRPNPYEQLLATLGKYPSSIFLIILPALQGRRPCSWLAARTTLLIRQFNAFFGGLEGAPLITCCVALPLTAAVRTNRSTNDGRFCAPRIVVATLWILATQSGPEGPRSDCNSDTQKGARAVCSGARAPRTLLHGRAALRQR